MEISEISGVDAIPQGHMTGEVRRSEQPPEEEPLREETVSETPGRGEQIDTYA